MDYVVEMLHITKDFPGIRANDNITLQLKKGEIHALLGENGAGKSTLMSILFGLYNPDSGEIRINGKVAKIKDPNDANAYGIGMVHQHFKLVHNFTVLENIILGVETTKNGVLQTAQAKKKIVELSEKYGLQVNPDSLISDITVGMQQRVEILKMLYRNNDILIFDEPTAVLTPQEIGELMNIMRGLTAEGKSILFITHKLNEIKEVANRCTVLRKGSYIGTVEVANTSVDEMASMMVGRKVSFTVEKEPASPTSATLLVQNLTIAGKHGHKNPVKNISFTVRKGEIVALAGIDGNGQSELIYALAGLLPIESGKVFLGDQDITSYSVRKRNDLGLSYIPEDRHKDGLILDYNLAENLVLKSYHTPSFNHKGFLNFNHIYDYSNQLIKSFDIRSGQGSYSIVRSMSGGNQQKAIVAREISLDPELLIAVQPTRGLDVGAIEYIHKQLIKQRDDGKAILLVSLELEEVLNVADRILVIFEGEIVADIDATNATEEELGLYMAGSRREEIS